jgi:hypothetical protein
MSFRWSKMKWSKCIWIYTVDNLKQLFFTVHFISIFQNLNDFYLISFFNLCPYIHFTLSNLHFPLFLLITFPRLLTQLTGFNICTFISFYLLLSQSLFFFLFWKFLCWCIITEFISLIIIIIITHIVIILWILNCLPWTRSIRALLFTFLIVFSNRSHFETLSWFCGFWRFINHTYLRNWINTLFLYSFHWVILS